MRWLEPATASTSRACFASWSTKRCKVAGTGEKRVEALRLADVFRAKVIDAKADSFVFEVTGNSDKVQTFIGLMETLGLVDVGRTGIVAMSRGGEAL